jgi:hypothetical protein
MTQETSALQTSSSPSILSAISPLTEVYKVYQKWFYIEDTKVIDLILAVKANLRLNGIPLWIWLVGRSGTGRTTLLETLKDDKDTIAIYNLTPRTLVSGKTEGKDLVNGCWDKLVIIPDFSEVLAKNADIKDEIFSQFRDLYDGHIGGMFGTGKWVEYEGKPPQMLLAVTDNIYEQKIVNDKLGTRELLYQVIVKDDDQFCKRAANLEVSGERQLAIEQCHQAVEDYLSKVKPPQDFKVSPEIGDKILKMTKKLAILRATAVFDYYKGELRGNANYELPSRSSAQLVQIYKALKALDPSYPDDRALEILEHIVSSSGDPITTKVYELLREATIPLATNEFVKKLRLGWKTVYLKLNLLWNIKVAEREEDKTEQNKLVYYWTVGKFNSN